MVRLGLASLIGLAIGGAIVVYGLYRSAEAEVQQRLSTGIWDLPGRVWSGPIEVWPGMAVEPEDLARDLQGAGYARVDHAARPGDFQLRDNTLLVLNTPQKGPGWATGSEEILITFRDGQVGSVSPKAPAVLAPTVLATLRGSDNEDRNPRALEDFPEQLRLSVLAMEDAGFYRHNGISPLGLLRAVYVNVVAGDSVQGGSTLTQQLAKNLFLSPERTYTRKARELLLALALERQLTKDELLALYLNEIYWGQAGGAAICGADQAARAYFGKPVDRVSLGEAATLAGIISSPNTYNPLRHPDRAKERRDLALDRLAAEGWLDAEDAEREKAKPLKVVSGVRGRVAPYAVDAAVDAAEAALGDAILVQEGVNLHTTINPLLQRHAERVLAESMTRLEEAYPETKGVQAALVAVRVRDGAIVALVGGRDYGESQFNRATLAARQLGSTVKPLTMLAAFERDRKLAPASTLVDEPLERTVDGKTWRPTNYDGQYVGELTVRQAIAASRNIPAVLLAEMVGAPGLQALYVDAGLENATRLPSAALGAFEGTPVQLAGAYTVFPGQGVAARPQLLRAVTDDNGKLRLNVEPFTERVASARATALATSVLQTVIAEGTGASAARFGATGALGGKTGTTDNYRDAWFAGFTPELAVAVWVGFDQGSSTGLSGAKAALPTWARFMAGTGTAGGAFKLSRDVVEAEFCVGGFEAGLCTECGTELFTRGEEPTNGCANGVMSAILDGLRGVDRKPTKPTRPDGADPEEPKARRRRRWFW
ncbi:MAG: PBP1A family penicillin-binding protein [Alphaproteobacteria bacterium]|nr:PBP1A family penicillin-binding protein [Alphaproteobacteria bacterium]